MLRLLTWMKALLIFNLILLLIQWKERFLLNWLVVSVRVDLYLSTRIQYSLNYLQSIFFSDLFVNYLSIQELRKDFHLFWKKIKLDAILLGNCKFNITNKLNFFRYC